MKYKHHPKQEYPDMQQQEDEKLLAALREVREKRGTKWRGEFAVPVSTGAPNKFFEKAFEQGSGITSNPDRPKFDWGLAHKAAEQERQEEEEIEHAIDQVENQKQQAGFYSDLLFRTGPNGEPIPNPRYAMTENGLVEVRPWETEGEPTDYRTPTLFERFNSLCTPAQYVQLKKEILHAHYQWLTMGTLCKHTLEGFKPEASVPWPQELEGFTEEIIESL